MNGRDRSLDTPEKIDSRIAEMRAALDNAEKKLSEREALIAAAFDQTEAARSQYEQANERAEGLRRRLDAKEQQLNALQSQFDASIEELKATRSSMTARDQRISSLVHELQQRDDRIAALEELCKENDNALNAIDRGVERLDSEKPNEQIVSMGMILESLDFPGTHHSVSRKTTTIGRVSDNDIPINSYSVSRYHARIVVEAEGVYLIDLQSTNGCSVNGRPISRQLLSDGDGITIGKCKFRFSVGRTSVGVDEQAMDATHALLDESTFIRPKPTLKTQLTRGNIDQSKTKLY